MAAFVRSALEAMSPRRKQLGPWATLPLPLKDRKLKATLLIPVPLHSTLSLDPSLTRKIITEAHELFRTELGKDHFEIILIVYGDRISLLHPIYQTLLETSENKKELRILQHEENNGRASALRTGFLASSGIKIFMGQIEQPSSPRFFIEAFKSLESGVDLVRANRRLPETWFRIPVELLPLVYRRHRLGLLFNRLVRSLYPFIQQTLIAALSECRGDLATNAFALQSSPDFLFDLEIALTAIAHKFTEKDLPVSFELALEKSVRRMTSGNSQYSAGTSFFGLALSPRLL